MSEKPKAVLYDIDGTLLDSTGYEAWFDGTREDYDVFHELVAAAPCIPWVVEQAQSDWERGREVLLVTARGQQYRLQTMDWLAGFDVPYSLLAMRGQKDFRSDLEVKEEIILQLMEEYTITAAYEDNPEICKWLESIGILVWKVGCR